MAKSFHSELCMKPAQGQVHYIFYSNLNESFYFIVSSLFSQKVSGHASVDNRERCPLFITLVLSCSLKC